MIADRPLADGWTPFRILPRFLVSIKESTYVKANDTSSSYLNEDRSSWGKGYGRLTGKNALVTGSTRGLGRTMIDWLA